MKKVKKKLFPCRHCHENILLDRAGFEEKIKLNGAFECPFCGVKITKIADLYTKI